MTPADIRIDDRSMRTLPGQERFAAQLPASMVAGLTGADVEFSPNFCEVVDTFANASGQTPAGFRIEVERGAAGVQIVDLVRDISRDTGGVHRPTPLLFSVDSVNPTDIAPWSRLVANLTCNPGIVYDLFLNDPTKNVNREFGSIDDVLQEIASILGPGCDVSVELHNPYDQDLDHILEEVARYESILTKHRLVVKVPHTGPIAPSEVSHLLEGRGEFPVRFDHGHPQDYLRGHNLAHELQSRGYRVNFTLMFEPYQTPLALQARPYFINAFIRNRLTATRHLRGLVAAWETSEDASFLTELRAWMISNDFLSPGDRDLDLLSVLSAARGHLRQRHNDDEPDDGLDAARQSLRWLSNSHLPDTRLILCSMDGDDMFPDITRMLTEPELTALQHRVLITTDPVYLSRWTSSPQVISYQRRFMRAAATA